MKILKATIIGTSLAISALPARAETAMERYEYVRSDWYQQVVNDYTARKGLVCDNTLATEVLVGSMGLMLASSEDLKTQLEKSPAAELRSWAESILQVLIDVGKIECH